jgi:Reverse transcriptase (RNA-dependent DNA polymerase)
MKAKEINIGKIIHLRALNYLRREHPLSYVGGRILAENIHTDILTDWTLGYILRRAKTGREPVFWQHSFFKAVDPTGKPEYRTCLVGSPTTVLQEVWALWRISQEEAFRPPPAVFSYLWPHPASHRIFCHFMDGYHERERAIARASELLKVPYVVVMDLKGFYPNLDIILAFQRFEARLNQSSIVGDEKESVLQSARGICRKRKKGGLPIGPPMAHVIASIYMENVDKKLEEAFSGRYFRYVDDVALVVERGDVERAKRLFREIVESDKLIINEDKTDDHPAFFWKKHVESKLAAQSNITFADLISKLTQYLAHHPENYDWLRSKFREEGFAIPFTNVKSIAEYRPFRRLVKRALAYFGLVAVSESIAPEVLLSEARQLRNFFVERANQLASADIPSEGIQRRWIVQKFRYTFNRLLYLVPRTELAGFEVLIPRIDDLAATRAIYQAMITGNATDLLHFSGHAVTAFAQLWSETQTGRPEIDWTVLPKSQQRDSIMVLSLYRLCEPPPEWIDQFRSRPNYNQTALKIAVGVSNPCRTHNDLSYVDEIECLFLAPGVDVLQLLKTRFDKDESIVLPALNLGEGSDTDFEGEY